MSIGTQAISLFQLQIQSDAQSVSFARQHSYGYAFSQELSSCTTRPVFSLLKVVMT